MVHRFERADQWEATLDDPARDAWQRPADVVDAMKIEPGMTVADVGAGTGYFEPWLSRAVGPTGTVLAIDIEPDMVRHLEQRAARQQLGNVRASLASTDDPKLPAASADRVLIVNTWHHIADRAAYAAKLRDGLKVGGEAYIVDFKLDAERGPPPEHRLTAEQVVRELSAAGLGARVVPVSLPDQYIVVGARER